MSRNSRLTADITLEAHNMLRELVGKHERSKGYLLERMIRKFCAEPDKGGNKPEETEQQKAMVDYVKPKSKSKRFIPPTVEEVFNYCNERCNNVDAQNFVDHYTVNNWMRGRNKIKDWKACVRTWEKNQPSNNPKQFSETTEKNIRNLEGDW